MPQQQEKPPASFIFLSPDLAAATLIFLDGRINVMATILNQKNGKAFKIVSLSWCTSWQWPRKCFEIEIGVSKEMYNVLSLEFESQLMPWEMGVYFELLPDGKLINSLLLQNRNIWYKKHA